VRVPPKLMAHSRDSARTFGKSDPIDALAVARAALREPHLPAAHLDGPDREIRLLLVIARRWSRSGRASSTGFDGTFMRSIPHGSRQPAD
jgi:transposase